jgi:hypothetical protein
LRAFYNTQKIETTEEIDTGEGRLNKQKWHFWCCWQNGQRVEAKGHAELWILSNLIILLPKKLKYLWKCGEQIDAPLLTSARQMFVEPTGQHFDENGEQIGKGREQSRVPDVNIEHLKLPIAGRWQNYEKCKSTRFK